MGVRGMLKRLLNESQQADELDAGVDMNNVADMLFDGMLGASVVYGVDKSTASLDRSIGALIDYLQNMKMDTLVESFNA